MSNPNIELADSIRNQEEEYYAKLRAYEHALMLERMTESQYAYFTTGRKPQKNLRGDWDDHLTEDEMEQRSIRSNMKNVRDFLRE